MLLFCNHQVFSQAFIADSLLPYLHGIKSTKPGSILFNVRGREVIIDRAKGDFSKPYVRTLFPGFDLHEVDKVYPDNIPVLGLQVLRIDKQKDSDSLYGYARYYFFMDGKESIRGIQISSMVPKEDRFDQAIIELILKNKIPDSLISKLFPPELQFVGKRTTVDSRCRWMGSNVMQCVGFGEMNWSMHPTIQEAKLLSDYQFRLIASKKGVSIGTEELVPVIFEGVPVTARRYNYVFDGVKGFLLKHREGSKTLIVYFVVSEVRGRFVSCVMSYWTSDYLENGLPPLLHQVMSLK